MTDMTDSTTTDTTVAATDAAAADVVGADASQAADDSGTALGDADTADDADTGADEVADAPVIPDAYELTLPEGMALDADLLGEATPIFKEIGLTNDSANKLMPFAAKLVENTVASTQQAMADAGAAQRKTWLDEAKGADDIGGPKWEATLATAAKGLDAMGFTAGTPFRKFLTETGIGNHADMIRIAAKLGELAGEDNQFARADAGAPVDALAEMYPNNRRSK